MGILLRMRPEDFDLENCSDVVRDYDEAKKLDNDTLYAVFKFPLNLGGCLDYSRNAKKAGALESCVKSIALLREGGYDVYPSSENTSGLPNFIMIGARESNIAVMEAVFDSSYVMPFIYGLGGEIPSVGNVTVKKLITYSPLTLA